MKYSIDTSAILDGWKRYYPPDVFPALWAKLDEIIDGKELIATEEVLFELEKKDDEVYEWAFKRRHMFVPIDEDIQLAVADILQDFQRLVDTRRSRSSADPFVIALAQLESCTVITGESSSNNLNRPNIPDVCSALGIRTINLLQLIREQGWTFHTSL